MSALRSERIALSTGVTLNVRLGGPEEGEAILFLHGFPESHRTWRHQLADLSGDHVVVAPDQRGYARSDRPEGVENYETGRIVADAMALMDALGRKRFTLVGHDWGGAVAWTAAVEHPERVARLVIVNAPHPLIFQKSLVDDPAQRDASQYMRFFRSPGAEAAITAMGLEAFLEKVLLSHSDATRLPAEERQAYLDEWREPGVLTAMINWYRASKLEVPETGEAARAPLWTHLPFPKLRMPVLVVWGMKDPALLPIQLGGLHDLVEDLRIVTSDTASHFITWEEPGTVTAAIRDFLAETAPAATPRRNRGSLRLPPVAKAPAMSTARAKSRSAARLAAVQALYQRDMEGTPVPQLLHEFHHHRLGATIEGVEYADAEVDFFDDVVTGAEARRDEIDGRIAARLSQGWSLARLDRPMKAILRAGAYELMARIDVPTGSVISEYVDVAKAFYDKKEAAFVNGILDSVAKDVRTHAGGYPAREP